MLTTLIVNLIYSRMCALLYMNTHRELLGAAPDGEAVFTPLGSCRREGDR